MEKISVAVRIRPPSCTKGKHWKVVDNTISLCSASGTPVSGQTFAFDHVFTADVKNRTVYESHAKEVITAALHGFNGTVFAYGQTSSGKTYTMRGSKSDLGLIGLTVHEVFSGIQKAVDREFLIRVSYMEIYNEDMKDLWCPDNRKLQIHENVEKGIFVAGLREEIVNSPEQVFELLELGEAHRHFGKTNMNVYSSRSHTIFRMVIESKGKHAESASVVSADAVRVSVLNLVDLAGSERIPKTGVAGVRLREGTHINKSLMTLGNVIKKLSDGATKQRGHVPYRDSKLTRILQPALGGNAKTAIICTIAPDEVHIDETRGTLQFASRAKRIMTCAHVNEVLTDAALLKRQQREIEKLRKKLQGFESELLEKEILHLRNDLLKYELEREKLALELQEEKRAQVEREQRIKEQELKIKNLSSLVNMSDSDDPSSKDITKSMAKGRSQTSSENCLVTVRRGKSQKSPVKSEAPFKKSGAKDLICFESTHELNVLPDFGHVADENLWFSLNDGRVLSEPDFLHSTPSRWTCSVMNTRESVASVPNSLLNSRIKAGRNKNQLEAAWKENIDLWNQHRKQFIFQKQIEHEILEVEREAKSMTASVKELCDVLEEAKVLNFAAFQDFFAEEKEEIHSLMMCADEKRAMHVQSLTGKIKELEVELFNCRQENVNLQLQNEALQGHIRVAGPVTTRSSEDSRNKEERLQVTTSCKEEKLFSPPAQMGLQSSMALILSKRWPSQCLRWIVGLGTCRSITRYLYQMATGLSTSKEKDTCARLINREF